MPVILISYDKDGIGLGNKGAGLRAKAGYGQGERGEG